MFMKYGDGKIISIVKEEDLTEEQKKEIEDAHKKALDLINEKNKDKSN